MRGVPGVRDLDRASRSLDVVTDPVVGRLPALGVELEPGGAGIAVARLTDAAGVDQPAALVDLQAGSGARLPAVGLFAFFGIRSGGEEQGDVGVADEADPLVLGREAVGRLLGPEDVLPDRIPWRRVVEGRVPREVGRGEVGEEGQVLLGGVLGRPFDRRRSRRREGRGVELAEHCEIVVPDQTDLTPVPREIDAEIGIGAVADHVAEAPALVDSDVVAVAEDRLEGRQVGVDVAEDGYLHQDARSSAAARRRRWSARRHRVRACLS